MDDIARLKSKDRSDLFQAAAEERELSAGLLEKDFWVCWVLRRIYTLADPRAKIHFKGGTSLSKVFGVIDRMSEDVDLVIDRSDLGFEGDKDPTKPGLSNKARQRIVDEIKASARLFISNQLKAALDQAIEVALGGTASADTWSTTLADDDPDDQTILFHYPTIEQPSAYVRPMVRLELGARGDPWPTVTGTIHPYAADVFPDQFAQPDTRIPLVVAPERTFWEKATILHMLHHQPVDKSPGPRMARHYYDTYRLAHHEFGRKALADTALLARVVEHKRLFFPRAWARYELAKPGSLKLTPPQQSRALLRTDYEEMAEEMMFGEVPDFESVVAELERVEAAINA
ncbi:MAG: nucleotidyl transferase AbiEii/AbiGii toxin family protein [Planctomycetes bacterium]|nr:nucleotidyl transferase AbiEii/AbiGii toxin family protein [Planctomycetota bacterium]